MQFWPVPIEYGGVGMPQVAQRVSQNLQHDTLPASTPTPAPLPALVKRGFRMVPPPLLQIVGETSLKIVSN